MNFEEQLASWDFCPTSLLAQELECAVSPFLTSNHSYDSAPQCENYDSELLKVLKLHSTLVPQEVQVCTSNSIESIPTSNPVRKDGELMRNIKKKRRGEQVEIPTTFVDEEGEDGIIFNDKHEYAQSSKVIRRMFERKRRKRITDKMKSLKDLLPHCASKLGADSVLDKSIEYIKILQQQIQSICSSGSLVQYVSQMPVQVPQGSPYFPVGAEMHELSNMRTTNMTLPGNVPSVSGVPCNIMRPGMIFPQALSGPSYYQPQYQVQMPVFNPYQQIQPASVPVPNMQQMSFPMLTDPIQRGSMVQDFATNSLSCPQLSGFSDISVDKGTKGNALV